MDTEAEFDFESLTAEVTEEEPVSDSSPVCVVDGCTQPPKPYGGKGPRPKKCVMHSQRKTSGTKSSRQKKFQGTDYTEGIKELLSVPATILGVVGIQSNNMSLAADAVVISEASEPIALAVNGIAHERPEVAAVLDKVLKAGPYGALFGALVPMTVQLMANHKKIKPGMMGTRSAEEVLTEAAANA